VQDTIQCKQNKKIEALENLHNNNVVKIYLYKLYGKRLTDIATNLYDPAYTTLDKNNSELIEIKNQQFDAQKKEQNY
jgi:predicted choloylglycine hydrolase